LSSGTSLAFSVDSRLRPTLGFTSNPRGRQIRPCMLAGPLFSDLPRTMTYGARAAGLLDPSPSQATVAILSSEEGWIIFSSHDGLHDTILGRSGKARCPATVLSTLQCYKTMHILQLTLELLSSSYKPLLQANLPSFTRSSFAKALHIRFPRLPPSLPYPTHGPPPG
jgi:hypothetical protein